LDPRLLGLFGLISLFFGVNLNKIATPVLEELAKKIRLV
jgi:hypothetical protein